MKLHIASNGESHPVNTHAYECTQYDTRFVRMKGLLCSSLYIHKMKYYIIAMNRDFRIGILYIHRAQTKLV